MIGWLYVGGEPDGEIYYHFDKGNIYPSLPNYDGKVKDKRGDVFNVQKYLSCYPNSFKVASLVEANE